MARFIFQGYEINQLDEENDEHLHQADFESTYEAIKACLDPDRRLDYLVVCFAHNEQAILEFSPYAKWKTWEAFEQLLNTHILATKIQLNIDVSVEQAAQSLLIGHIDLIRHQTARK